MAPTDGSGEPDARDAGISETMPARRAQDEEDDRVAVSCRRAQRIHPQRSRVSAFSCGLGPIAGGNFSRHSNGRVASMTTRELKPLRPGSIAGSSGPLQARRMISKERSGSERVQIAQITSLRSETSMSSSTTTVMRPRYAPARTWLARWPAWTAWPG